MVSSKGKQLLVLLLGGLNGDELVALLCDDGLDVATVRGGLLELLSDLELQLHRLQGSRGFDGPDSILLGHLK